MPTIPSPCLLLLTDRTRISPNWTLAQAVAPAITGGCNLVVLRETDIPSNHRLTVARFVRDGVKGRIPFLIGGDASLAAGIGAQGVHLSAAGPGVAVARESLGPDALIGVSVRDRTEAEMASAEGADYLLIEYDWSAPDRVWEHFRELRTGLTVPVIIGTDMDVALVPDCVVARAAGVAICAPAMSAYDRTSACRAYVEALGQ